MVVVIIPTYNEKKNIDKLISSILDISDVFYIVVVDDNSNDGTSKVVKSISTKLENVYLLKNSYRKGRGKSSILGFKFALDLGADIILEMDADFSHDPECIPKFLNKIKKYDVVIGSRYVVGGEDRRGFLRKYITKLAHIYIRIVLGIKGISDVTSGYRCFKKEIFDDIKLKRIKAEGPFIITEMFYKLYLKRYKIKEMPIIFYNRADGSSKLNIFILLSYLFKTIKLRLETNV